MNAHIAEAVKQQAETTEAIDRNVVEINGVAEQNVTASQNTNQAANQMADNVSQLRELLHTFKIE